MRSLLGIVLSLVLLVVVVSCADTCDQNKNALPRAGFYAYGDDSQQITLDSIEVIGVGMKGDSALSGAGVSKKELYLPFRIDCDSTQYVFINARRGSGQRDTVTFCYTRTPRLVSAECGVSYLFEMTRISWQGVLIDSVACPAGYIDNSNSENIRIYFAR